MLVKLLHLGKFIKYIFIFEYVTSSSHVSKIFFFFDQLIEHINTFHLIYGRVTSVHYVWNERKNHAKGVQKECRVSEG